MLSEDFDVRDSKAAPARRLQARPVGGKGQNQLERQHAENLAANCDRLTFALFHACPHNHKPAARLGKANLNSCTSDRPTVLPIAASSYVAWPMFATRLTGPPL